MAQISLFDSSAHRLHCVVQDEPPCAVEPFETDSFIARSIFQKAIRRGDELSALRATATLMELSPDVIWRRLLVTALEDIGIADQRLVADIVLVQSKRARRKIADDWSLAVAVVRRSCAAVKCQAANDLHNIALHDPTLETLRSDLGRMSAGEKIGIAADPSNAASRRYAAAHQLLAEWNSGVEPVGPLFDQISGKLVDHSARYLEAHRRSNLGLALASVILLSLDAQPLHDEDAIDDYVPNEAQIGGIPSYSLDQYTRAGRRAIDRFVLSNTEWRRFAGHLQVPQSIQSKAAGELLFRVEGAAVRARRRWEIGQSLYRQSLTLGCFLPPSGVPEGLSLIRDQLPNLTAIRSELLPVR